MQEPCSSQTLFLFSSSLRLYLFISIGKTNYSLKAIDRTFNFAHGCVPYSMKASAFQLEVGSTILENGRRGLEFCIWGMYGLGSGISLFIATNIFQGFRVVLPMRSKNSRGQQGSYPIKLFYTSNMPIILQSAQLLYRKFSGNFFVNLLGQWKESEYSGQSIPVSGLAYLITTPAR
ncbi:hypothetical protein DY000_02000429 [Brassica cretica]|uniref:Uncharacterized protein n=1 Tax=Brassica cretica TaxID=69181 RepID=A0ABQ7C7I6_BRACR|nr:hypothetical protein DY000_02000429 [Brassica cretica]